MFRNFFCPLFARRSSLCASVTHQVPPAAGDRTRARSAAAPARRRGPASASSYVRMLSQRFGGAAHLLAAAPLEEPPGAPSAHASTGQMAAPLWQAAVPQPPPAAPWSLQSILWDASAMQAVVAPAPAEGPSAALLPRAYVAPPAVGAPAARAPRAAARRVSSALPGVCAVLGCTADLRTLGAYYVRNHLCGVHLRSAEIQLPEGLRRFCQARPVATRAAPTRCAACAGAVAARARACGRNAASMHAVRHERGATGRCFSF
jgi:hypothetical protein